MSKPRWVNIYLVMPERKDLKRGMEIANKFEEDHGDKPSMYFSVYASENSIVLTVKTKRDDRVLRKILKDAGAVTIDICEEVSNREIWASCHMYQVAKHLDERRQGCSIQAEISHLYNMLGFTAYDVLRHHIEAASIIVARV